MRSPAALRRDDKPRLPSRASLLQSTLRSYYERKFRLYQLVWQRAVASQMTPAVLDTVSVDVLAGPKPAAEKPYLFRATGSRIKFKGFMAVYTEGRDEDAVPEDEEGGAMLPPLEAGEILVAPMTTRDWVPGQPAGRRPGHRGEGLVQPGPRPSPPEGPPKGTYFSRRNATAPSPPLPAAT